MEPRYKSVNVKADILEIETSAAQAEFRLGGQAHLGAGRRAWADVGEHTLLHLGLRRKAPVLLLLCAAAAALRRSHWQRGAKHRTLPAHWLPLRVDPPAVHDAPGGLDRPRAAHTAR